MRGLGELSAFALARFGISPDEFGKMGPGYFAVLCYERDEVEIEHFWPAAAIQATLCNLKRDEEKKPEPFSEWDFMPGWEMEVEKPVATREEISRLFGAVPRGR